MLNFKEVTYIEKIPENITCVLGADIGGTNSNFGVFSSHDGKLTLLLSIHFKSQEIKNFTLVVQDFLDYIKNKYKINITYSSFAAAGVVSEKRDYCKPTNLDFALDAKEIIKNTSITCAIIVNDFEIIGFGIDIIDPKNLVLINKGKPREHGARAILGAGTGLGKCILHWNNNLNKYLPVPSEGGHADFCPQSQTEYELTEFIKTSENRKCNISWEDVLSGNGISRIYDFFYQKNGRKEGEKIKLHPDKIFESRNINKHSSNTYSMYSTLYARCAKNLALDSLALGGVYIAGGIASKNIDMFKQKIFIEEFTNCCKQYDILKNIPVYIIADYNISLYGAAEFMILEGVCF